MRRAAEAEGRDTAPISDLKSRVLAGEPELMQLSASLSARGDDELHTAFEALCVCVGGGAESASDGEQSGGEYSDDFEDDDSGGEDAGARGEAELLRARGALLEEKARMRQLMLDNRRQMHDLLVAKEAMMASAMESAAALPAPPPPAAVGGGSGSGSGSDESAGSRSGSGSDAWSELSASSPTEWVEVSADQGS